MLTPAMAMAGNVDTGDAFYSYYDAVNGFAHGGLGIGLAITMLLMGGLSGVARNSPIPALSGVAGAAILHWGPDIIRSLMLGGALI
jgi:conjugal transfer pilus assembly protein TraA